MYQGYNSPECYWVWYAKGYKNWFRKIVINDCVVVQGKMQATRSLASKATRPLRVNADARTDYFMKHCNPSLVKTWKSYAVRNT